MESRVVKSAIRRVAREFACGVLDCIAPRTCIGCAAPGPGILCPPCETFLERRRPPYCAKCGAPLGIGTVCAVDHDRLRHIAFARAPLRYAGTGGAIVRAPKFRRDFGAGAWLARAMADTVRGWATGAGRRARVVSVPLHPKKLRRRGLDQAEWLGAHMSHSLGLAYAARALRRVRVTLPQGDPRVTSRDKNIAGAFVARGARRFSGRPVLLVDDVATSLSTARECARVLRAAGASAVVLVTACDARG